ncbi:OmpA family protein [Arenimonas daejeonensis]|uniref:OmpA family protein n=1 Tax=Arenimonas daejeonensis TaxID=370777 RepID=UPI002240004B
MAGQLRGGGGAISIEGHTDSQGADAANQALSQRRAEAVRRVLEDAGLPSARLSASGRGESAPVADNATAEGRARNRRVEIIVN